MISGKAFLFCSLETTDWTVSDEQRVSPALLNVLSQSYPNIEYIVIDGGSTDGTVDIIRRYESGLAYWVSEPDKGIYDAMNKGLQKATGDYVWFINAGDTLCSSRKSDRVRCVLQNERACFMQRIHQSKSAE